MTINWRLTHDGSYRSFDGPYRIYRYGAEGVERFILWHRGLLLGAGTLPELKQLAERDKETRSR